MDCRGRRLRPALRPGARRRPRRLGPAQRAGRAVTEVRRNIRTYRGLDRPDVEVLVDGRGWVAGEVRMQWQDEHDAWWAEVQFRTVDGLSSEIDAFPADHVRKDET